MSLGTMIFKRTAHLSAWCLYSEYCRIQGDTQMALWARQVSPINELGESPASNDPISMLDVLEAENTRLRDQVAQLALQIVALQEQVEFH